MVDICGRVVGVNTFTDTNIGFGIASDSIKQKILEMAASEDPLKDVEKIVFQPNKNALEAVRAFYNYIKIRKFEQAFDLLSDNFKEGHGFEYWVQGYQPLLDTSLVKIESEKKVKNRIQIKLTTIDFVDEDFVYKCFQGYWDVKYIDGHWLLWKPNIMTVEEPTVDWFYE